MIIAAVTIMLAGAAPADAIVTYEHIGSDRSGSVTLIARQRGDWMRIDEGPRDTGFGLRLLTQEYVRPGQAARLLLSRMEDGSLVSLSIYDDPRAAVPAMTDRQFTGASETHLGRSCRVWRTDNPALDPAFVQTGCVTGDGIEMWRKHADTESWIARAIRQVSVSATEVLPPAEALDPALWLVSERGADHEGDYEVELVSERLRGWRSTVRRSGGARSQFEENFVPGAALLTIEQPAQDSLLSFTRGANPRWHLHITRKRNGVPAGSAFPVGERMDRPAERLLGRRCKWWNMSKGVQDVGRYECRTADGMPLKITRRQEANTETLIAVRVRRTRLEPSDLIPPKILPSPADWGFGPED